MSSESVTFEAILAAYSKLQGVVTKTPVHRSSQFSQLVGGEVAFKCENLQRTGSYKVRGSYVRISNLTEVQRSQGVVAASAGNHAQGVALASREMGIKATVYMPAGAPLPKLNATSDYGATVELVGHTVTDALAAARKHEKDTGAVFIHPFDHPDIVAGQASVGLEILEQFPEAASIVVPVGGGGLAAGVCLAVKELRPDIKIIGVQAENAACYPPSLAAGQPKTVVTSGTMADGIMVQTPGDLTFGIINNYIDDLVTVTEQEIARVLVVLLERAKLVVEPAGAVGIAALVSRPDIAPFPAVPILSGGNIDPQLLMRVVHRGLVEAGRFTRIRIIANDRPGFLGQLLTVIAGLGANILEVEHSRIPAALVVDQAEVTLELETRGVAHQQLIMGELEEQGYECSEIR